MKTNKSEANMTAQVKEETLAQYVAKHAVRGECRCGRCADVGSKPDPKGHTADLVFFTVGLSAEPTTADAFRAMTRSMPKGAFADANPLDGQEHNYISLGAWIGDQGLALMYMGLGTLLGVFNLLTPAMLGFKSDDPLAQQMAGMGYIAVQAVKDDGVVDVPR